MQTPYRHTVHSLSLGTASLSPLVPHPTVRNNLQHCPGSLPPHITWPEHSATGRAEQGGSVPGNCDPTIITSDWLNLTYFPSQPFFFFSLLSKFIQSLNGSRKQTRADNFYDKWSHWQLVCPNGRQFSWESNGNGNYFFRTAHPVSTSLFTNLSVHGIVKLTGTQ